MDDYAKDGVPGAVSTLCSFNCNALRRQRFNLGRYEAEIHKLSLNSISEPVYLVSKPYELK